MKTVFTSILILFLTQAQAQTASCIVMLDSLKGDYEGACEKGKANGEGKAFGAHFYEGNFKNGYPEGQGKYTWRNGDQFTGTWKKGLKEGKGQLKTIVNGKDSLLTGFWKKDVFKGEYENPYLIINTTTDISRAQATKMRVKGNRITMQVENLQAPTFGGGNTNPYAKMTNYNITRGSFVSKQSNSLTNKEITIFQGVIFPFRGIFTFNNTTNFEIEIFEEGEWEINIPINK